MGKGIKNTQVSFGESNLTHFGGLFLIHSFCKKLRLKQTLQLHVKLHQKNQEYQTAEFILLLLYTIILGIARIENVRFLQTNGVFKKIVGIKKLPPSNRDTAFSVPSYSQNYPSNCRSSQFDSKENIPYSAH